MPRRRRKPTRAAEHRKLIREHRTHYDELLAFQGGGCAICGKPPPETRRHAMDHDHKSMELRGILCTACNMRLSNRVTLTWLYAAYWYLKETPWQRFRAGG